MEQKLIDTKEFMKKLTEEIDAVSSEDYDGEEMSEYDWASGWWISTRVINKVLESTTAIEAEPVVRCKDCKFNYANQIPSDDECQLCVELPISKDFYCAYGEKMDEVNDEVKGETP